MRPSIVSSALVLLTTFTASTVALEALASSPCADLCGNILTTTTPDDMVCQAGDFSSTAAGSVFQGCITCQLQSKYQDPVTKQTDLQWALFNLRYAMTFCLFGVNNPNAGDSPCETTTACGPLANAFEYDGMNPNASAYSYCANMDATALPKCTACLKVNTPQFFLNNYVVALEAACQQQPVSGQTISIQGSLFSSTAVNITSPSSSASASIAGAAGHGLSLGDKVGIAVAGIVLLLATLGFCIIWNGKRRRRAYLKKHQARTGYSDWLAAQQTPNPNHQPMSSTDSQQNFFDSPQSTKPLVPGAAWGGVRDDESPMTGIGEKVYFSPYSSQYNSPISAADQPNIIGRDWPIDRKGSFAGSTGLGGSAQRSRSRDQKERIREDEEGIPMQNVAPVLNHPGHGRQGSLGLTADDNKHGNAV